MGGVRRFEYPKYVWSPAGGWWCNPRQWKKNTLWAFVIAGLSSATVCVAPWHRTDIYHRNIGANMQRKMTRDWASLLTTITTLTEFIFIPRTAGEHSLCGDEDLHIYKGRVR
ncbi:hypothetical protein EMCRGX_G019221 [Ephydatia muelleri]